jgi:hypothetical protein
MAGRWRATTLNVLDLLGRTKFQAQCEAVLATVNGHPKGVAISNLYRAHRGLTQRDFEAVLGALETQKLITTVKAKTDRGRPPAVFFPWGHAPARGQA